MRRPRSVDPLRPASARAAESCCESATASRREASDALRPFPRSPPALRAAADASGSTCRSGIPAPTPRQQLLRLRRGHRRRQRSTSPRPAPGARGRRAANPCRARARPEVADRRVALTELLFRHRAAEQALTAYLRDPASRRTRRTPSRSSSATAAPLLVLGMEHGRAVVEPRQLAGRREREAAVELPPFLLVEHFRDCRPAAMMSACALSIFDPDGNCRASRAGQQCVGEAQLPRSRLRFRRSGMHPRVVAIGHLYRHVGEADRRALAPAARSGRRPPLDPPRPTARRGTPHTRWRQGGRSRAGSKESASSGEFRDLLSPLGAEGGDHQLLGDAIPFTDRQELTAAELGERIALVSSSFRNCGIGES